MNSNLKKFIGNYVTLSYLELEYICSKFKCKLVKKNDHLLRQEDICKDLVSVQKDCLRLYYLKDDIEIPV